MTISIAHSENVQKVWVPVKPGATCYVGGICAFDSSAKSDQGIIMLPQAVGASNTTNKDVPFGVIKGTNLKTEVWDSTYKTNKITAVAAGSSHGDTTEYVGVEGPWGKGDNRAMVEVELIGPSTVLKAPLYNNAVGTALTVLTATAASTDGLGTTTNATQVTPVADVTTAYCRTGGNVGAYRILDTTSTTVHTWTQAVNNDIAVGDTFVITPGLPVGPCFLQTGATCASYIDASVSPATNYWIVTVLRMDLREAGKEYVEFRFDADNFSSARA